jgi:hypothetical protein
MSKISTVVSNRNSREQKAPLFVTQFVTLAALVLAAPCAAAPGASVVAALTSTSPGGFLYDGARMWVTDAASGLCRIDGNRLTNCVKPAAGSILGQPAYDAVNHLVYVPDSSTTSNGIWRYAFGAGVFNAGSAFNVAAGAGLGVQQPGAIALGSDGNLYVSMTANGNLVRVNTPATATQTVDRMGTTLSGLPAQGLAIVVTQLWIADRDGVVIVPDPVGCATKCNGTLNKALGVASPSSIAWDSVNGLVYVGTGSGVFRHNPSSGQTDLYSGTYVKNGIPGLFSDVTAVGTDSAGNLYLVDDPTAGQAVGGAGVYSVPAGSLPDSQGPVPTPPPTIAPTIVPGAVANPAAAYTSGGLTTPRGAVLMGAHLWVVDATLGFCKVDPTLLSPSLTACAVLAVGFVAGAPAFDSVTNLVYLPDTTPGGAGIVRLKFNPANETVGAPVTVVKNNLLTAASKGTAPTALTFGPDGQVYAAMAGSPIIVRVTTPAAANHTVRSIGAMFDVGSLNIAFFKGDLYAVEKTDVSFIQNATLCKGTCTSLFLAVVLNLPAAVASDANYLYIGDGPGAVWRYDPVANLFTMLANTGLSGAVPTPFSSITGIAPNGTRVYVVDSTRIWLTGDGPLLTDVTPFNGSPGTSVPVVITGSGLTGATLNMPAGITATGVTVVSDAQINATFNVAAAAVLGTVPVFTATTPLGASNALSFSIVPPQPKLTTIAPAVGIQGTSVPVTITGANLLAATLNIPAGITATTVATTATQITATFVIALNAPIGPQGITATTPAGTSGLVFFTVKPPAPTLTSVAPAIGVQSLSALVILTGTNLTGGTLTLPTGVTASSVVITPTQISAVLAVAATAPLGPSTIGVTTPGGSATIPFTINPLPPVLTSIVPATGFQGGSVAVVLTGTKLTGALLDGNLQVGITATGVTVVSDTQITATFNVALTAILGPQPIIVTTAGGASNSVSFTVTPPPPPTVTSIAPAMGVVGTTVPVTITGANLSGTTLNLPAGITATALVATSTQVTAGLVIAPAAALGAKTITLTTPGGTTAPFTFTVNPPLPTLTSITPNVGGQGSSVAVTIAGTNLTGSTLNLPAGVTASAAPVVTATQITATFVIAATTATGAQNITVTTTGGTSSALVFTVNPPAPTLASVAPALGVQGTSVPVTITGTNLTGAVLNLPAGVTTSAAPVVTATQVTATFVIAATAATGAQNITVTTAGGASSAMVFTVNPPPPALAGIAPASGVEGTSVPVTIAGTNLTGATLNLPAGVTTSAAPVVTATQIAATFVIAATAATGPQNITVTTAGGTSSAVVFTVFPTPTLGGIAPAAGVQGTGVPVTITGTNLTGAALNLPVGITTSAAPVVTATQITATFVIAASAATGPQIITVTTAGGTSSAVVFTVNPPTPALAAIAPTSGVQATNVAVTLTGTNLTGATLILPPGITTSAAPVATATQITATFVIAATAATGAQNITVTTAGGGSSAVVFTVNPPPPALAGVAPAAGVQGTSVAVTLTGTNLIGAALNLPAGFTTSAAPVVTATQITATFVIGATAATGPQNITVTTTGGTSAAMVFTVNPPTPVLASIAPASGVQGTSVPVTITGTSLTGATLTLPAGVTTSAAPVVTATQITATFVIAATAATGPKNITVTTTGGTSSAVGFTVNPPAPTLASIAPTLGVQGTSVPVTITGTNLTGATLNLPAGVTTSAAPVVTATQITATFVIAASAATGAQNITVTTIGGTSSAMVFTVNPPPPTLAGIAPTSGVQGTSVPVTITGTNLTGAALNLPAGITTSAAPVATATQITATFVIAATAAAGPQNITVTTAGGTSTAVVFTVNPPPSLAGITPASGVQGTSVPITITGTNLTGATLNLPAGITTSAAPVTTATQVTATFVIAATAATGPQIVTVTTPGGTSSAAVFTVNPPPPTVASIAPAAGVQGASVPVTITGTNLTGASLILPAGVTTSAAPVATATQITATFVIAAAAPTGPANVIVTTAGGNSSALVFTINVPPPALASIAPASGVQGASVPVTLTGTNLTGAALNLPAGITTSAAPVVTATQITATLVIAATTATGPQNITVTTVGGTSAAVVFTVNPPPALAGIAPASGVQGTSVPVTITGTNLTGAALNLPAGVTTSAAPVVTATQITATLVIAATAATGPQNITVTTTGGTSSAMVFTVIQPAPTLASIAPASGVQGASVPIIITGTNLTGAVLNLPAGITTSVAPVVSATQITATFVIAATTATGPQNITVTTAGGTSAAVVFTVNVPSPALASIAPASGASGASVPVTITGTNLTGAALNLPAGITTSAAPVVTATQITATFVIAATAATGPQSITATTVGGTSTGVVFTVNPPAPTLAGIAPASGVQGASVTVTITGANLSGASLNLPAGVTASAAPVVTVTQITATLVIAATAATGPQNITVTTAGGNSSAVVFTVIQPVPSLASIAPASGSQGASVPVVIAGANLTGAVLNLPAGITTSAPPVVSATQITATFLIAAAAATGPQSITVTTVGGTSAAVVFTVNVPPPALASVTPASGVQGAGVPVIITGANLTGAALNLPAGVTTSAAPVVSATQITATFVIAAAAATGPQSITVTTAGGTSSAVVFTVNPPPPTLTGVAPASGVVSTSVPVTLTGTSLTGAAAVNAGAGITVTNFVVVSSTQITATLGIAATATQGSRNITVTTPAGVTNAVTFNVLPPSQPPAITSINSPFTRGVNNQNVTVSGTNLAGATAITAVQVFVNGTAVPLVVSSTPVAGSIIVQPGSFLSSATQLSWNWTMPATLRASSQFRHYTMTVTTLSGTSAPVGFTVR